MDACFFADGGVVLGSAIWSNPFSVPEALCFVSLSIGRGTVIGVRPWNLAVFVPWHLLVILLRVAFHQHLLVIVLRGVHHRKQTSFPKLHCYGHHGDDGQKMKKGG